MVTNIHHFDASEFKQNMCPKRVPRACNIKVNVIRHAFTLKWKRGSVKNSINLKLCCNRLWLSLLYGFVRKFIVMVLIPTWVIVELTTGHEGMSVVPLLRKRRFRNWWWSSHCRWRHVRMRTLRPATGEYRVSFRFILMIFQLQLSLI